MQGVSSLFFLSSRIGKALFPALLVIFPIGIGTVGVGYALGQTGDKEAYQQQRDKLYLSVARDVAQLERQGNLLKRVVKLIRPTVVHIEAEKDQRRKYDHVEVEEAGSGVVVKLAGRFYVLTNLHVINHAKPQRIKIQMYNSRHINPRQILSDRETDIAVMSVPESELVAARLGDSDRMEIGDFVLAVGSPFGLSHSVTYGIISATGRYDLQLGEEGVKFQDFIQTDAAINPGNSGGPLMNLRGEVIGLNTAIASASGGNEGIGFAIPINLVKRIALQLIEQGKVERAFLGVKLDAGFNADAATALGLPRLMGTRINSVTVGSPAERAKLQVGDVIVEFAGVPVVDDKHLVNIVGLSEVGREVPLVVHRGGKRVTLEAKMGAKSIQ